MAYSPRAWAELSWPEPTEVWMTVRRRTTGMAALVVRTGTASEKDEDGRDERKGEEGRRRLQ